MIVLGIILLLIAGYFAGISILYTIGGILLVIGIILWILGAVGRPVGRPKSLVLAKPRRRVRPWRSPQRRSSHNPVFNRGMLRACCYSPTSSGATCWQRRAHTGPSCRSDRTSRFRRCGGRPRARSRYPRGRFRSLWSGGASFQHHAIRLESNASAITVGWDESEPEADEIRLRNEMSLETQVIDITVMRLATSRRRGADLPTWRWPRSSPRCRSGFEQCRGRPRLQRDSSHDWRPTRSAWADATSRPTNAGTAP